MHGGDIYRNRVELDFSVNIHPFGAPAGVKKAMIEAVSACDVYPDPKAWALRRSIAQMISRQAGEEIAQSEEIATPEEIAQPEGNTQSERNTKMGAESEIDWLAEHTVVGNGASELIFAAVRAISALCDERRRNNNVRSSDNVVVAQRFEKIWTSNGSGQADGDNVSVVPKSDKTSPKVLLLEPTFSGYIYALRQGELCFDPDLQMVGEPILSSENGFAVTEEILEYITGEVGMLILTNPNNPTGRLIEPGLLQKILVRCREQQVYVLLDECFLGFAEDGRSRSYCSAARLREFPGLLVMNAFTKLYGIPGVRLGYLQCSDEAVIAEVVRRLPEWNTSVIAQEAGKAACREHEFVEATATYVKKEREFLHSALEEVLRPRGGVVYASDANFILFYLPETVTMSRETCSSSAGSSEGSREGSREGSGEGIARRGQNSTDHKRLYDLLLERGILIRDCSDYRGLGEGWYRVAVLTREKNDKLIEAMREVLNGAC